MTTTTRINIDAFTPRFVGVVLSGYQQVADVLYSGAPHFHAIPVWTSRSGATAAVDVVHHHDIVVLPVHRTGYQDSRYDFHPQADESAMVAYGDHKYQGSDFVDIVVHEWLPHSRRVRWLTPRLPLDDPDFVTQTLIRASIVRGMAYDLFRQDASPDISGYLGNKVARYVGFGCSYERHIIVEDEDADSDIRGVTQTTVRLGDPQNPRDIPAWEVVFDVPDCGSGSVMTCPSMGRVVGVFDDINDDGTAITMSIEECLDILLEAENHDEWWRPLVVLPGESVTADNTATMWRVAVENLEYLVPPRHRIFPARKGEGVQ